jgi:hypothetical protein
MVVWHKRKAFPKFGYLPIQSSMYSRSQVERNANEAMKQLRLQKLSNGMPFMINAGGLEPGECFLEFPDGKIALVSNVSRS